MDGVDGVDGVDFGGMAWDGVDECPGVFRPELMVAMAITSGETGSRRCRRTISHHRFQECKRCLPHSSLLAIMTPVCWRAGRFVPVAASNCRLDVTDAFR